MNVKVVTLPRSQVSLDIEVDSAAIGHAIDRSYQHLAQRYSVPGFRKGKAPRAVLDAALGRTAVLEEAADIAINDAYQWALDETGLVPITKPEVSIQSEGLDPSQPLFFTAKFYVEPTVELGDYRSVRVERPKTPVTEEMVDEAIQRLADREAPWEPVEDRPAAEGDLAIINLVGTIDGETVVDEQEEEYYLDPARQDNPSSLNIASHLLGMNLGEERDVELVLPEDYEPAQYAGKTMSCHVELVRLEHKATPILDDAFAQSVGEYSSLDELRARTRERLEAQQALVDAETFVDNVLHAVTDSVRIEIPPPMIDDEVNRMIDRLQANVERERYLTFDLYLRLVNKTLDQLREETRPSAEASVKSNLILEKIAEVEGITAPKEAVDAELRQTAALPTIRERDRRRILTSPAVRARIEARYIRRLALQRLLQIADPKSLAESADNESGRDVSEAQVLEQAAQSRADALESDAHPGEEET